MAFNHPGGNNPVWGRDEGPPPGFGGMHHPAQHPHPYSWPPHMFYYPPPLPPMYNIPFGAPGPPYMPPPPFHHPYGVSPDYGGYNQYPASRPIVEGEMPAAYMTNSTGGIGCEPGYNYFFPAEHTKIHVLKTGATPPWQFPMGNTIPFHACHVPVRTTVGELLKGFGATNPCAKKNKIFEVTQGANGNWYRGLCFSGDEKDNMSLTLKEIGWDMQRSGLPGMKPVVTLYVTKD